MNNNNNGTVTLTEFQGTTLAVPTGIFWHIQLWSLPPRAVILIAFEIYFDFAQKLLPFNIVRRGSKNTGLESLLGVQNWLHGSLNPALEVLGMELLKKENCVLRSYRR